MQEDERPASQHRPQPSHQSAWDQPLGVDGLAMSIDGVGGGITEGLLLRRVPELSCPSGKRIGQGFSLICPG